MLASTGLLPLEWGATKVFNHLIATKIVGISDLDRSTGSNSGVSSASPSLRASVNREDAKGWRDLVLMTANPLGVSDRWRRGIVVSEWQGPSSPAVSRTHYRSPGLSLGMNAQINPQIGCEGNGRQGSTGNFETEVGAKERARS